MGAHIIVDPASGKETVVETFTCAHCNTPQHKYTFTGKKLVTIRCGNCKKLVCANRKCVETCVEFEKRLDVYDRVLKQSGRQVDIFKDLEALQRKAIIIG